MVLSSAEENYLKAIYKLTEDAHEMGVGTNELSMVLQVKPGSVTEMLKKLKEKSLVDHQRYGKISLTEMGRKISLDIVRKHRLWETFLYEKLEFSWDEVHEIAEELEHIHSKKLIDKLDKFLNYPKYDPHGDPIPNKEGKLPKHSKVTLAEIALGTSCKMVAVRDNSTQFLQYLISLGIGIHDIITKTCNENDGKSTIATNGKSIEVSKKFMENIYVVALK